MPIQAQTCGCHTDQFSIFPDFSLITVKFPWPNKYKSDITSLQPPLIAILSTHVIINNDTSRCSLSKKKKTTTVKTTDFDRNKSVLLKFQFTLTSLQNINYPWLFLDLEKCSLTVSWPVATMLNILVSSNILVNNFEIIIQERWYVYIYTVGGGTTRLKFCNQSEWNLWDNNWVGL